MVEQRRPIPLARRAQRAEFRGIDVDRRRIEGDGVAVSHQHAVAEQAPQLGQCLAQAATRQLFLAVAPQHCGQPLARPADGRRQGEQRDQGAQFPSGKSQTVAVRADELEAPQHAYAHG